MRIKCYCELYTDDLLKKRKEEILAKLEAEEFPVFLYIITLADNPRNSLEFFPAVTLKQPAFEKKELFVIGLAADYAEAAELVRRIAEETVRKTGGTDVRGFILSRQKLFEEGRR